MAATIRTLTRSLAVGMVFAASVAHAIPGQPGTLDPSFAASSPLGFGKVMTAIGIGANWGRAVALQPDGKALLAGGCQNASGIFQFCVARYRADGVLDTSWNGSGTVTTSLSSSHSLATGVVVQPDGKVVVTGKCNDGNGEILCAARYAPTGALDNTWNGTGYSLSSLRGDGTSAAIQADGKIIVAGACLVSDATHTDFDLCATRFTSSGVVDTTWNGTGSVTLNGSDWDDHGQAIVVQPDGKVILAGYCNNQFCAARYLSDGTLDTTWNGTGLVVTPKLELGNVAYAAALQPDGKLLLGGNCVLNGPSGTTTQFCSARYNTDGTIDTSWSSSGLLVTPMTSLARAIDEVDAIVVQPGGKVTLVGTCYTGSTDVRDFCSARLFANGTLDTSWNSTGKVFTPMSNVVGSLRQDFGWSAALQPDGKLLVGGYCWGGNGDQFCLARYDGGPHSFTQCSLDLDGDGRVLATTDTLISTRVALGLRGDAVVNGVTFPANATRNSWPLIQDFLVTQCGMSMVP